MTIVPGGDPEADWCAMPETEPGKEQQAVLQSIKALPEHRVVAGTDSGAIQVHFAMDDDVFLAAILQACS